MRQDFVEKSLMSLVTLADRLVGEEMLIRRIKRPEARKIIAREAGITPGALEGLSRGRLKFVDRIAGPLNALLVRKIEQRIISLEHELAVAKALGRAPEIDLRRAESALEEARQALGK